MSSTYFRLIKSFIKYCLRLYGQIFFKQYKFKKNFNVKVFGLGDIAESKNHYFVGYYDIDPICTHSNKIICHKVSKKYTYDIMPAVGEIGLMSIEHGSFTKLTETRALNWQIGSRAQWLGSNKIIYNDIKDNLQISRILDTNSKEIVKEFDRSFWAISPDKKIGASLNFSRIKIKRPGYGYQGRSIDGDQEVFSIFDIDSGNELYAITLNDILKNVGFYSEDNDPYLNHVTWSPCSTKLITMFHFAENKNSPRKIYPVFFDIKTKNWEILDDNGLFSHHIWLDKDTILAFRRHNKELCYCIWNKERGWLPIKKSMKQKDGHPSLVNNTNNIIFDIYPDLFGKMHLYKGSIDSNRNYESIGYVLNPKIYNGPLRCDLHPRVSKNNKRVVCDIPHRQGRKILVIDGDYDK